MDTYEINAKEIVDALYKANADKESFTDFFDSLQKVVAIRLSLLKMKDIEELKGFVDPEFPDCFTWVDDKGKGEDKISFEIKIPKEPK